MATQTTVSEPGEQPVRRAWGSMRPRDGRKIISEPWSEEEDKKLARLVEKIGKKDWCMIASVMDGRTARQCRERYCNHVDEAINRGAVLRSAFACSAAMCRVPAGSRCKALPYLSLHDAGVADRHARCHRHANAQHCPCVCQRRRLVGWAIRRSALRV
jgi:hypothetical protein